MKSLAKFSRTTAGRVVVGAMICSLLPSRAAANPTGPVVTRGGATVTSLGSQLTVQTAGNAFINWRSFNIGAGESTVFLQPNSSSVVWNRINDPNPSQILGSLTANGLVVLQNPSGFYVGGQAVINAAGIIMTTSRMMPPDISAGSAWQFNAPPPTASIINYGQINAGPGGPLFLIAHNIENHGTLTAPGGNIGLYAGKEVLVSARPDGLGLSASVVLPEGSVDNSGNLIADAGTIALHAKVVNQGGLIQANSVRERNGVIEVFASDSISLAENSVIEAKGDSQGTSAGGNILIKSANTFQDSPNSIVNVSGGAEGGNGGQVEISATHMDAIQSHVEGHAEFGSLGGRLLIDPVNITLTASGTGATSGTINAGDPPSSLTLNVNSFSSFSQILLQATQNITLSTVWNLGDSAVPNSSLTLQAGNNITLNAGTASAGILAGNNWKVNLVAGADFLGPNSVISGVGGIYLNGNSFIQTQDGGISLHAGKEVLLQNPSGVRLTSQGVRTLNGGAIDVLAMTGNVNTGGNLNGYTFRSSGVPYTISSVLGGISTANGGDVTINAGGDVVSSLPTTTSTSQTDGGSGAFGSRPGVVTVTAGGNVYGHFVAADSERNGQLFPSTITALNGNVGGPNNLFALSLVKGGWQVNAPNGSIYLQEVRNPSGALNGTGNTLSPFRHLFDYAPTSFVDLEAPNGGVHLEGTLLPRYTSDPVQIIYPPILTINAGAGGVTMGNDVTLFPSPFGELNISTTAGGSFDGGGHALIMSDSSATKWTSIQDFSAADHAATPVQLDNPNPVSLVISGNLENVNISTPKRTEITVGGDMNNTSVSAQNLHPTDVTFFDVAGSIFNPNIYSFVTLPGDGLPTPFKRFPGDQPNYFTVYSDAVVPGSGPSSANSGALFNLNFFVYNAQTKRLGYYGQMDPAIEQALLGPLQVKTYTLDGQVIVDAQGRYVTQTAYFGADPVKLAELYTASLSSADPSKGTPQGYQIGGPGQLNILAKSLDLGITQGVTSEGPALNPALARLTPAGADINIGIDGDLTMYSSAISSLYGGVINIFAAGSVNVGSQELLTGGNSARGIWSSGRSDVNIIAAGNIDVAGSRIAAFNGGDVTVISLYGNVDAGSGGDQSVKVNEVLVDPVTFAVATPQQPIAGSGIMATTLPDAPIGDKVGNIAIVAYRGNINASQGGIVQEPLNGNTSLDPTLTLIAGTRDSHGRVIYPGDINAGQSGVIGVNTFLYAAGNITGLVIARGDSTINAAANVSGTFLAGGSANFNAGGTVSGIAIAGNSVNVGSGTFEGVALAQNVSGGGAQSALASSTTASTSSQSAAAQTESAPKAEATLAATEEDEEAKRKAQRPLLAKTTGRVTVLMPGGKP